MTTALAEARPRGLGPNYRKLWSSAAASNLADGVFLVALPLIAVRLTDSPVLIAGVAVAGRLPWLVFVLFAGALADRLDRRLTMRNVQLMRVLVVGLMALLALGDELALPVLYVAAFVLGVGETLFDTAAQSLMPSLVDRDQLNRANGRLYAVELTMNTLVGPPLGGFLVAVSVPLALAGSALGYALAAVGLVLIVGTFRPTPEGPPRTITSEIRDGFAFLWHNRVLRSMAMMVAIFNLGSSAVWAVLVLFAVAPGPMGLDEVGFGVFLTAMALGGIAGTLVEERLERRLGRSNLLFGSVIVTGSTYLVPVVTAQPLIVAAALTAQSAAVMCWNIVTVSLRQRITPDGLLGRVNATYRLFAWGSMPVGAILGGVVAELAGLPWVFVFAAVAALSMVVFRPYLGDASLLAAETATGQPAGEAV